MTIAKKILAGGLTEQEAIDRAAWSAKGGCGVTTSGSGFTYTHNTSASGPHNTQVYDATPGDTMTWTLQNLGTTNAITLIYQHQTNGSGTLTLTVSPSTPGTHSFTVKTATLGTGSTGWTWNGVWASSGRPGFTMGKLASVSETSGNYAADSSAQAGLAAINAVFPITDAIIEFGVNDCNAGVSVSSFATSIGSIVTAIQAATAGNAVAPTIILMSPPDVQSSSACYSTYGGLGQYAAKLKNLAQTNGYGYIGLFERFYPEATWANLYADGLHLSITGGQTAAYDIKSQIDNHVPQHLGSMSFGKNSVTIPATNMNINVPVQFELTKQLSGGVSIIGTSDYNLESYPCIANCGTVGSSSTPRIAKSGAA